MQVSNLHVLQRVRPPIESVNVDDDYPMLDARLPCICLCELKVAVEARTERLEHEHSSVGERELNCRLRRRQWRDIFPIGRKQRRSTLVPTCGRPPVPGGTQRMVPADGQGTAINGSLYFPPGTHLRVHRDPRNFYPKPEGFWPDRWLRSKVALPGSVSAAEFKHNGSAFTALSQGPMNCVGRALAMQEMAPEVAVDGQLGGLYDMARYDDEYQGFFVTARASVPVVLQVRKGKHA
ncbi:uncharacterized protein BXZ73DRAFT_73485 [Epithele typhae]|uniref:uncharacterized protein n=1 Tax=Epithele typhae TaxID=378194 RepID=UPI002008A171|nr:uncharacterized protein BXZ73DRAFT_73485 [Epithele typhae]KAH9945327.1 hypothetical protein BXZ73DRAFT_73485 [Epithele typhae]